MYTTGMVLRSSNNDHDPISIIAVEHNLSDMDWNLIPLRLVTPGHLPHLPVQTYYHHPS